MANSRFKPWWVWYTHGTQDDLRMFDEQDEALQYQADPKGREYLGDKVVMRVAFRPWEPWESWAFTHDTPSFFQGPETREEATKRNRFELLTSRLRKAGDKSEKLVYVEKEMQPTEEELADAYAILQAEKNAKEERARRKAVAEEARETE